MTPARKASEQDDTRTPDKPTVTFEQALQRLETIVEEMEKGTLGLEDMLARFEEGQRLLRFCSVKLNEVEKRVELLVKQGDKLSVQPFEYTAQPNQEGETPTRSSCSEAEVAPF